MAKSRPTDTPSKRLHRTLNTPGSFLRGMFVFLLRSREALRKGGTPDPDQCLRVGNLVMSAGGHPLSGVDVAAADEAVLFMGKSKADQEGQGHVLNAYATDHWLCVVSLLKLMHLARPGHFGLDNMRGRAQEIGASLTLTSAPGEGSEVRVEWKNEASTPIRLLRARTRIHDC